MSEITKIAMLPSPAATLLSIGDDPFLLHSRQFLLQAAGYRVYSVDSAAILNGAQLPQFDLGVLCHSIPAARRERIVRRLRRFAPSAGVLLLAHAHTAELAGVPTIAPVPGALLRKVKALLAEQRRTGDALRPRDQA